MLALILFFTFIGSIVSLIGGIFLLLKKNISQTSIFALTSFAAGVLLSTVFLNLYPEAIKGIDDTSNIFIWSLLGIVIFFLFEHFFRWYHSHQAHGDIKPSVWLITIGDSLHNFIDGTAISAAFLTDPSLGIITSFAVAAHEIPHEIADFSVLLEQGLSRKRTLIFNLVSSMTAFAGAIITYYFGRIVSTYLPIIIAFTAGQFIYIAGADLIPELHHASDKKIKPWPQAAMFIVGVILVMVLKSFLGEI